MSNSDRFSIIAHEVDPYSTSPASPLDDCPVAWRYRWHELDWVDGAWSDWALLTRDPRSVLSQCDWEVQPLYAAPVAAPVAAGSDEVDELADKTVGTTPALTADKAEIARLRADLDIAYSSEEHRLTWQALRTRAETAESRCAALMAERDGLREALARITGPGSSGFMRRTASAALEAQERTA